MSIKNRTDLNAQVDVLFPDNSTQFITAAKVREHLTDLDDSAVNLLGDLAIQGKLGYSTLLTISSNGDIPHKKYVDDAITAGAYDDSNVTYLDGSRTYTGNQDVGGYSLNNVNQITGSSHNITFDGLGISIGVAGALDVILTSAGGDIKLDTPNITASTVAYLNASKKLVSSAVTPTELGYVSGVSSAIQTQFTGKQATLVSGTNIKTINGTSLLGSGDITISGAVSDGDKGDITVSSSGTVWTIDNGVVTNAMLAGSIAASKLVGSDIATVGTITTGVWSGTVIGVTKGGTGLTTVASGSVLGYNSADTASAITSTSGLKTLQNNAGTISWITTTGTGDNVYGTSPTFTTAIKFASGADIQDANGNILIDFPTVVTSAVNYLSVSNAIATGSPSISSLGSDTNIAINLIPKGTGQVFIPDGSSSLPGLSFSADPDTGIRRSGGNILGLVSGGSTKVSIANNLSITAGVNISLATSTGSKIGAATNELLSFWNATPIVQPTTAVAAATFVANTSAIANDTATFDGYTIGQIVKALRNTGLLA